MKKILIGVISILTVSQLSDGKPVAQAFPVDMSVVKIKSVGLHQTSTKIKLSKQDYDCLTKNIYFESGVEPLEGKIAVAQITFNRLNDGRWGNSVCKVVYAKHQFSWTKDKNKLKEIPKGKLWEESIVAANRYLNGTRLYSLNNSTHYHATWIDAPKWALVKNPVDQIGQHIFYAMK